MHEIIVCRGGCGNVVNVKIVTPQNSGTLFKFVSCVAACQKPRAVNEFDICAGRVRLDGVRNGYYRLALERV